MRYRLTFCWGGPCPGTVPPSSTDELYDASQEKDNVLRGSVMATLSKKLLVNSIGVLFDLLTKLGSRAAIMAVSEYLSTAIYKMFRQLYQANPENNRDFFSVSPQHFSAGLPNADMICSEVALQEALEACKKEDMPPMNHNALSQTYPGTYQSLFQIIHTTGERINYRTNARRNESLQRREL